MYINYVCVHTCIDRTLLFPVTSLFFLVLFLLLVLLQTSPFYTPPPFCPPPPSPSPHTFPFSLAITTLLFVSMCHAYILSFFSFSFLQSSPKEIHCLHRIPEWGSNLQPKNVPWWGIEQATFPCTGPSSTNWDTWEHICSLANSSCYTFRIWMNLVATSATKLT